MPTSTTHATAEKQQHPLSHFPALDGLRGIAIISVIIYHCFPYGDQIFGWLGVDLFFVLSGFLITRILINGLLDNRTVSAGRELKHFYIRRSLRIWPLYFAVLLLLVVILPGLAYPKQETAFYRENLVWYLTFLQNWKQAFVPSDPSHCLNHFWSLAVEEQFYLIWPFIILLMPNIRRLIVFLLLCLLLLFAARSQIWHSRLEGFNYTIFYTFTRFDGILIGCLTALVIQLRKDLLYRNKSVIIFLLAGINLAFYFFNRNNNLPYLAFIGYTTFAALFGMLVFELTYGTDKNLKKMFSWAPLRYLGKISYGLYVFHWPVYYFLSPPLIQWLGPLFDGNKMALSFSTALTCTLLSLLISHLSFRYFETPFLRLKKKFVS